MTFLADLHIHSRFSRATSKALNPGHLAAWARCKGITVLGTGDFTHPQWREELRRELTLDAASGLYALKKPPPQDVLPGGMLPQKDGSPTLFLLQAEISSIYKRGGKVRKVHNLVFVPTLDDAENLSHRLAQIGNLHSDGRPILGLDSRDLLEIMLECAPGAVMIPAHVWTPWFALFGSKSGFDRLEDCYGDLSSHIFALETGLSSDPAMNRLVSALDGYALVSNSDAHSGANLGREANLFAGSPGYEGIFTALRAAAARQDQSALGCRFLGTLEFYPDEGKYHLDGHRACNVVLEPRETRALGNICPVCGKPLTVGVLHRVLELADRAAVPPLPREPEARPLIPLPELVSEILGVGTASRKTQERYAALLRHLGPELDILCQMPVERIRDHWEPLGEAVSRMRQGQVFREGGYDGHYGTVRVFSPEEKREWQKSSASLPGLRATGKTVPARQGLHPAQPQAPKPRPDSLPLHTDAPPPGQGAAEEQAPAFSSEQEAALRAGPSPALVLAGPGAGKTRVLIGRLQSLLEQGEDPGRILALTFTRRAAAELRQRLTTALPDMPNPPLCDTLHGLAWRLRQTNAAASPLLLDEDAAHRLFCAANPQLSPATARRLWGMLLLARETHSLHNEPAHSPLAQAAASYRHAKNTDSCPRVDYADLLDWLLDAARQKHMQGRIGPFRHVLVDEVQDLSPVQLDIIRALLPADGQGFFGIGDPDQAIYGFRGAAGQNEASLRRHWPGLEVFRLGRSYRSSQSVLDMARSLLHGQNSCGPLTAARSLPAELRLFAAPDAQAEARWVASNVRNLLGGTSHTLQDRSTANSPLSGTLAPGDVAVLVRLKAQIPPLHAALEEAGIPCAAPAREFFWQDAACARLLALLAAHCGFAHSLPAKPEPGDSLPWPGAALPPPEAMTPWLQELPWAGSGFTTGPAWRQCRRFWQDCGSWQEFFSALAWQNEAESVRARAQQVQIMTLHASKGLEFQAVFLPGLEDGLLPLRRELLFPPREDDASEPPQAQDEEVRLLYVGLTRAARAIFASHAARRTLYGHQLRLVPSPFLDRIRDFCRQSAASAHTRLEKRQLSLLEQ